MILRLLTVVKGFWKIFLRAEGQELRAEGQGARDATDAAAKENRLPRRDSNFIAEVMDMMEGWKRSEKRFANGIYTGQSYWEKCE